MEPMSNELALLSNNEFVAAALQTKYKKINVPKRQAVLSTYIAEVFKFRGQIANSTDLVDMARDLDRKLAGDEELSLLTLEEVRVAFLHGVAGDYGEYYGINYVTLSKWVTSYFYSAERLEAVRKYIKATERQPQTTNLIAQKSVETTEWEREMRQIEDIKGYFEDVKAGREINGMQHFQSVAYHYLVNRGFLNPTKEEKEEAKKRAIEWLHRYRSQKHRSIMEILDDGYDSAGGKQVSDRDKVIRKAKTIILADWLKSLDKFPDIEPLNRQPQTAK